MKIEIENNQKQKKKFTLSPVILRPQRLYILFNVYLIKRIHLET